MLGAAGEVGIGLGDPLSVVREAAAGQHHGAPGRDAAFAPPIAHHRPVTRPSLTLRTSAAVPVRIGMPMSKEVLASRAASALPLVTWTPRRWTARSLR